MKTWMMAMAAVLLGSIAGIASTWAEFSSVDEEFQRDRQPTKKTSFPENQDGVAVAVVLNGEEHDFGTMGNNTSRSHTFRIKNVGTAPLQLEQGETTCKCTISKLENRFIQPEEIVDVTLEWTPKDYSPEFRQSARIHTNDPNNPTIKLVVTGQVTFAVRMVPNDLVFSSISSDKESLGRIRVYGYREKTVKIEKHEFSNREIEEHFDLNIRPLSEDELDKEPGALSGLELIVRIKPGLPLGAIRQTIRLTTNIEELDTLEIPVLGSVVSDISVLGRNFDSHNNLLDLGLVKSSKGAKVKLFILVKGPYQETVTLTIGKIDPDDVLRVTIGDPIKNSSGKSLSYPLTIEIPAGSRAVNRLGSRQAKRGKILIESTHPTAKQIQLYVSFATEGS